ncbi:hypothetical protein PILCRDRAFT_3680 [Piloderma croceum F 1598]|uniref:Uncharacterized protein n=1 Tax=Piloderma croceum (strain F 1598) TaxID=765440 RepID=A0A0C3GBG2_PILCF|nr:hypothetical protein PILCRDRAFT_3680 [Piloderma croceum F 1598]
MRRDIRARRARLPQHEDSRRDIPPPSTRIPQRIRGIPHHNNNSNPPPLSSTQNQPPPSPRNYSDINLLLQDIQDGDSEAIAYMVELNWYTEECGKIEMEKQMNGDDEYS